MLTIKQINSNIAYFKTNGAKIDAKLHETGVAIMQHAKDHGDFTAVNRLLAVFPKSGRKQAFIKWFQDHTPYSYAQDIEAFKLAGKGSMRQFMIEEANNTPFWEYTVEAIAKDQDFDKAFASFVKSWEAKAEKSKEAGKTVITGKLAQAKALLPVA